MSIFTHLVPATIEQARASQRVTGEEDARLYAQLDHLLAALRSARGEEKPEILRLAGDVSGRRVLDAGCGSGPLSAALRAEGAVVSGFDATKNHCRGSETHRTALSA